MTDRSFNVSIAKELVVSRHNRFTPETKIRWLGGCRHFTATATVKASEAINHIKIDVSSATLKLLFGGRGMERMLDCCLRLSVHCGYP